MPPYAMRMQTVGRSPDNLTLSTGPNDLYAGKAIIAVFYVFGQLVSMIRDTFEFGDENEWRKLYDQTFDKPPDLDEPGDDQA